MRHLKYLFVGTLALIGACARVALILGALVAVLWFAVHYSVIALAILALLYVYRLGQSIEENDLTTDDEESMV